MNLLNYLPHRRFYHRFGFDSSGKEVVILVHGLLHRSWVMVDLGRELASAGYRVVVYDYPTTRKKIQAHGAELQKWLQKLVIELPADTKFNFITHSMGGLITRFALGENSPIPPAQCGKWVMLGVPHLGSPKASLWMRRLPYIASVIANPLPELCEEAGAVPELPYPENWEILSIIGRYDKEVPKSHSLYPKGEFVMVESSHAFIMNKPQTRVLIADFLKKREKN